MWGVQVQRVTEGQFRSSPAEVEHRLFVAHMWRIHYLCSALSGSSSITTHPWCYSIVMLSLITCSQKSMIRVALHTLFPTNNVYYNENNDRISISNIYYITHTRKTLIKGLPSIHVLSFAEWICNI